MGSTASIGIGPLNLASTRDGRPILWQADLDRWDLSPQRSGGRLRYRCPVHDGDHQRSFSVDPETGKYTCHNGTCVASQGGTLRDFWRNQNGQKSVYRAASLKEIGERALARQKQADEERIQRYAADIPVESARFLTRLDAMSNALSDPSCPGVGYLTGRGLDPIRASELGVGYASPGEWLHDEKRTCGRIVYPLSDPLVGRTVSAVGRLAIDSASTWSDKARATFRDQKQRKLKGCPAGIWPYTSLAAAREHHRPLIVVEGPADALALLQHKDVPCDVIALVGTATVLPLTALTGVAGVVLALDSDQAGMKATRGIYAALVLAGIPAEVMPPDWLGGTKDAGQLAQDVALCLSRHSLMPLLSLTACGAVFPLGQHAHEVVRRAHPRALVARADLLPARGP